jgi:hypothetical protein
LQSFVKAVEEENELEDDLEGAITFDHWGTEVTFIQPAEGQLLAMMAMGGRSMKKDAAGNFIHLFIELGDDATQRYFQNLLFDRKSGFTLRGEGGLFDIWEGLVEEWSGKDSDELPASPKSRSATGTGSTAHTPRKRASASSRSRSTGS